MGIVSLVGVGGRLIDGTVSLRVAKSADTVSPWAHFDLHENITVQTGLFINGDFVPAFHDATLDVENPTSGQVLATVSAAQSEDVDRAVKAAKEAYSSWKRVAPIKRGALLNKLADLVERSSSDLASLQTLESGQLYRESLGLHVTQAVETLRYYAGWADKIDGSGLHIQGGMAYTRREPIGVCAAIVPWNTL